MTDEDARGDSQFDRGLPGIDVLDSPREGLPRLKKKEEKPAYEQELPLKKTGRRIEVDTARRWERGLDHMLHRHPELFQALRAVNEGRPGEATDRQRRRLIKAGYLQRDGSPKLDVADVMTAALRVPGDGGIVMVDPVDINKPEDKATLERAEDALAKRREGWEDRVIQELKRAKEERDKGKAP
jgi:hypothetical protein